MGSRSGLITVTLTDEPVRRGWRMDRGKALAWSQSEHGKRVGRSVGGCVLETGGVILHRQPEEGAD